VVDPKTVRKCAAVAKAAGLAQLGRCWAFLDALLAPAPDAILIGGWGPTRTGVCGDMSHDADLIATRAELAEVTRAELTEVAAMGDAVDVPRLCGNEVAANLAGSMSTFMPSTNPPGAQPAASRRSAGTQRRDRRRPALPSVPVHAPTKVADLLDRPNSLPAWPGPEWLGGEDSNSCPGSPGLYLPVANWLLRSGFWSAPIPPPRYSWRPVSARL
jgi:hypothetical protein